MPLAKNTLRMDPTRTMTLRRGFVRSNVNRVFLALTRTLRRMIVDEDVFGLNDKSDDVRGVTNGGQVGGTELLPSGSEDPLRNVHRTGVPPSSPQSADGQVSKVSQPVSPTTNKRWKYKTSEEAADAFEKWLKDRVDQELMSVTQANLWRRYIKRGFEKGAARAFTDTEKVRRRGGRDVTIDDDRGRGFKEGAREQFMRTAMSKSVALEKLQILQSQALAEVKGMSSDLILKGRRSIVDSLVRGLPPREVADRLEKVLGVSRNRAETIAYTELVRAHAEGQLTAMEALGVENVGVAVEWSTTTGACSLCKPLDNIVLKPSEARGMIPRHPRCKCAWIPANVGEDKADKKKQVRGKYRIDRAVKKSQTEGGDKAEWGPNQPIDRERPKSVLNSAEHDECLCSFSTLLAKAGLLVEALP